MSVGLVFQPPGYGPCNWLFDLPYRTQALSHEVGEIVRLPGGITSVDHTFRVPLNWGRGQGGDKGGGAQDVEVFARWAGWNGK